MLGSRVFNMQDTAETRFIHTDIDNTGQKLEMIQIVLTTARYTMMSGTTFYDYSTNTSASIMKLYA